MLVFIVYDRGYMIPYIAFTTSASEKLWHDDKTDQQKYNLRDLT
jgi:hypothetical protein